MPIESLPPYYFAISEVFLNASSGFDGSPIDIKPMNSSLSDYLMVLTKDSTSFNVHPLLVSSSLTCSSIITLTFFVTELLSF